jgi:hypothetical protein
LESDFQGCKFESEAFERAEELLEELRPESPLAID